MFGGDPTSAEAKSSCQPGENGEPEELLEKGLDDDQSQAAEQLIPAEAASVLRSGDVQSGEHAASAGAGVFLADQLQGHSHGLLQLAEACDPAVDRGGRQAPLAVRIFR